MPIFLENPGLAQNHLLQITVRLEAQTKRNLAVQGQILPRVLLFSRRILHLKQLCLFQKNQPLIPANPFAKRLPLRHQGLLPVCLRLCAIACCRLGQVYPFPLQANIRNNSSGIPPFCNIPFPQFPFFSVESPLLWLLTPFAVVHNSKAAPLV